MKKIIASTLITLTVFLGGFAVSINAEEVILCMSHTDQYVVMVDEKEDCLEDENQMILSGSDMEGRKSMTPVANFKEHDKCDGEGTMTEIGFDKNGNGKLDSDEIASRSGICNPALPE